MTAQMAERRARSGPWTLISPGSALTRELARLHTELVKVQLWVQQTEAKICIVFEGRDSAGKGGAVKAITERVSPRVFRVVALPAPTEREESQMYMQRYIPHLPAGDRHFRPRRCRTSDGVLHRGADEAISGTGTAGGTGVRRLWHHLAVVLARGELGRADAAA
jgi:hypothetical protein